MINLRTLLLPWRELRRLRADRDALLAENAALVQALRAERVFHAGAIAALRRFMPTRTVYVACITEKPGHER